MGVGVGDILTAAALLAEDPGAFGGLWLRGADDELQAAVIEALERRLRCRKVPAQVDPERLIGGLDVAATLAAGKPMHSAGLLGEMAGGVLIIRGAERIPSGAAGLIAAARDQGGPALLLIDEGTDEERPPASLTERVAFHCQAGGENVVEAGDRASVPDVVASVAHIAMLLGIASPRADGFALRTARLHSLRGGRIEVSADDLAFTTRVVLAPRATRIPAPQPEQEQQAQQEQKQSPEVRALEDTVVEAARAALPAQLLTGLNDAAARKSAGAGHGYRSASPVRGRPVGARKGMPRGGARLALIDTLRAAAPWQKLRGRTDRPLLRGEDLHVRRFETRSATLTVLAVDASGSAAAARLAEAKGAAELLLQQSYARRAEVALVAFRGSSAELLLPPTRSLTRARRLLSDLPGGGATPLAAGIDAALEVAVGAARRGRAPSLVVLTDGRANVTSDGRESRSDGDSDARLAARRVAASGIGAVVIDIGARARPEAEQLAAAMKARYLHLPRADGTALNSALA